MDQLNGNNEVADLTAEQLFERNQKLTRILHLGKLMSTQKNLDSLLSTIIHETSEILDADRSSLFIVDETKQQLWLKLSEKQEIKDIRFSIDKGIAGYVARTRQVINIDQAYTHALFNPEIDQKTGFNTVSMLCAPLENMQGKLIGVIQVLNKKHGTFTLEDQEILFMFCSLAAILLENSILEEEALKKERMAMVGNMASTIIHDIKNPMTSIRGLVEIIGEDAPQIRPHTNVILKSVDRLLTMTQELLDFSKGIDTQLQFEKIDCQPFFNETFSFIQNELHEHRIEFFTNIAYHGDIEINPDKIQRAIYNITGNARDAMKKGGTLSIGIEPTADNKDLLISISDTGCGMPEHIRETIFEPFVTFGKKNGTGLGMAITKKIIDAHAGSIQVYSTQGQGSRFKIRLPLRQ